MVPPLRTLLGRNTTKALVPIAFRYLQMLILHTSETKHHRPDIMGFIFSGKLPPSPCTLFLQASEPGLLYHSLELHFTLFGTPCQKSAILLRLPILQMAEPLTSSRAAKGGSRQDSQKETITRGWQNVQVPPQASQSKLTGIQQQTTTINSPAGGVERPIIQDTQPEQRQASLSDLPQRGTGLTPDTACRRRKWFKTAMPPYQPATKAATEDAKHTLIPSSRSTTERETYPSLHDRRTKGFNLKVAFETEFFLSPEVRAVPFQRGFVESISRRYNDDVSIEYPQMTRRGDRLSLGTGNKWNLFENDWRLRAATISEQCEFASLSIIVV